MALVAAAAAEGALPTSRGLPAAVTITIPLAEADRLTGHTHTTCSTGPLLPIRPGGRIDRTGTLGAAAGRFLMCCADLTGMLVHHPEPSPLATLLGAAREEPLAVGRTQRLATPTQRKALAIRDKGCVIAGCAAAPQHCQPHHTREWADGGTTDLDTLALLCWPHHRQVDLGKWLLTRNPDPTGPHWTTTPTPATPGNPDANRPTPVAQVADTATQGAVWRRCVLRAFPNHSADRPKAWWDGHLPPSPTTRGGLP